MMSDLDAEDCDMTIPLRILPHAPAPGVEVTPIVVKTAGFVAEKATRRDSLVAAASSHQAARCSGAHRPDIAGIRDFKTIMRKHQAAHPTAAQRSGERPFSTSRCRTSGLVP
jgi:hypothetical protein